ncbi:hypothetical protein XENTR_v10004926 [Xenopus tropicalis]|nr:hypothetical protein XENTR_v10004926 [Xenopus tropicalis]KAE8621688.1 hypothetical protein XENTR_v10004926 [Xenopus tropicalis]
MEMLQRCPIQDAEDLTCNMHELGQDYLVCPTEKLHLVLKKLESWESAAKEEKCSDEEKSPMVLGCELERNSLIPQDVCLTY